MKKTILQDFCFLLFSSSLFHFFAVPQVCNPAGQGTFCRFHNHLAAGFSRFFFLLFFLFSGRFESCAIDTTPHFPVNSTDVANDASYGCACAWLSPANGQLSENTRSNNNNVYAGAPTNYLKALNFGFSIPSNAVISGIRVYIERSRSSICGGSDPGRVCDANDDRVMLVKGGVISGNNNADKNTDWGTTDVNIVHGSSSDLWGLAWTYSEINASDFGVVVSAMNNDPDASDAVVIGRIDAISIIVTYTVAAPVEVIDFLAVALESPETKNPQVHLSWLVQDTGDPLLFSLERSRDGESFTFIETEQKIKQIKGGSSYYSYKDNSPYYGTSYYRLRIYDTDGNERLSYVREVTVSDNQDIQVNIYPNPSTERINIQFVTENEGEGKIIMMNTEGKKVIENKFQVLSGENEWTVPVSSLPGGLYMMRIGYEGKTYSGKIIIRNH